MASDVIQVRDVTVSFTANGEKRHPVAIALEVGVNTYPSLQVVHHGADAAAEGASEITSEGAMAEMGAIQNRIFRPRGSHDCELSIEDGKGGRIEFKGLASSPNYGFNSYNVQRTDYYLPAYARMDSLDFSCYQAKTLDIEIQTGPRLLDSKSIPQMFYDCGQYLRKQWADSTQGEAKDDEKFQIESQRAQDKINQEVMPFFQELMTASLTAGEGGATPFGWEELFDFMSDDDSVIRERMLGLLRGASGSFLTTICQFAEEYQGLYIPGWDNVGVIENRNRLFDTPKEYVANPINVNIQGGYHGIFPTHYVAVTPAFNSPDIELNTSGEMYVVFPESQAEAGGTAIRNSGPPWLAAWKAGDSVTLGGKVPWDKKAGFVMGVIRTCYNNWRRDRRIYNTNVNKILKAWAKSVYYWQSLGASSCAISVPLDLSLVAGHRYIIKNQAGKELLRGFLMNISHTLHCAPENGEALTSLNFTHIELPGFELPGKDG